jgi:hypothetical protein
MRKQKRAPNRIYPEGFKMDREEFMFRCFMTGAKKIHERLTDKRVKLNIHNNYNWKSIHSDYTGRGFIWFNVKMGRDYDMFWQDWESECKKLKMRYTIRDNGSYRNRVHTIRFEW